MVPTVGSDPIGVPIVFTSGVIGGKVGWDTEEVSSLLISGSPAT